MKKLGAYFSVGFLVLALACSKDNKNVATTTPQAAPGNSESEASGKTKDFENSYQGSINDQYQIEMNLKRTSNKLSGTYFYTKQKKDIEISGTIDLQNNLILNEFDSGGNQTGMFKGIISSTGIEGTWSKPNGDKAMPFSLTGINHTTQSAPSTPNMSTTSSSTQPTNSGYALSQGDMMRLMQSNGVWSPYGGWRKYEEYEILRVGQFNEAGHYWPAQVKIKHWGGTGWVYMIHDVRFSKNDYNDWEARMSA